MNKSLGIFLLSVAALAGVGAIWAPAPLGIALAILGGASGIAGASALFAGRRAPEGCAEAASPAPSARTPDDALEGSAITVRLDDGELVRMLQAATHEADGSEASASALERTGPDLFARTANAADDRRDAENARFREELRTLFRPSAEAAPTVPELRRARAGR